MMKRKAAIWISALFLLFCLVFAGCGSNDEIDSDDASSDVEATDAGDSEEQSIDEDAEPQIDIDAPSDGYHYDDGIFAFDYPEGAEVTPGTGNAAAVTVMLPRPDSLSADKYNDTLIVATLRLAPTDSSYWKSYELEDFDAEILAKHIYAHPKEYLGGDPTYSVTTVMGQDAYTLQTFSDADALSPGYRTDYYLQLEGSNILWIRTMDFDNDEIRAALDLILTTLEVYPQ